MTITPGFNPRVTEYAATTSNNSNKITATAEDGASILVKVDGVEVGNGESYTWSAGENTVTITVSRSGKESMTYTVIVTKS